MPKPRQVRAGDSIILTADVGAFLQARDRGRVLEVEPDGVWVEVCPNPGLRIMHRFRFNAPVPFKLYVG